MYLALAVCMRKLSSSLSGQECVFNYYLLAIALRCERDDAFFLKSALPLYRYIYIGLAIWNSFFSFNFFLLPQNCEWTFISNKKRKRSEHQINNYFNIHFVQPLVQIKLFVRSTYLFKTLNIEPLNIESY